MPNLKVTYFDARGRAEAIRLALTIGDIPFEDKRVKPASWMEVKPTTPYGSLPLMEVDGKAMAQSLALLRYAGKLARLYPEDALSALKVDEVLDVHADITNSMYRYRGKDEDQLRMDREKLVNEDIPKLVGGLEKRLKVFGNGPYAVGDSLTLADIAIAISVITIKTGMLDFVPKDALDGFPRVMKAHKTVMDHPKVVDWFKKHPVKIVL